MKRFLSNILPQSTKNKYHKAQAKWARIRYGNPSRDLTIIGVTGTKGKTTVCSMISAILDAAGLHNAMETTISTKIGNLVTPHRVKDKWVTTPPASVINKFFRQALDAGCKYLIMEVTSQAIDQYRVFGIEFDVLVYTNLSHDHLDYHKTKENYLAAKMKVFEDNPNAIFVINRDDAHWNKFYDLPAKEKFLYSVKTPIEHGAVARKILKTSDTATFTAAYDDGQFAGQITVALNLPGVFNVQNALSAFCVGRALAIEPEIIKKGLESIETVTGRMESIRVSQKQDFTVLVDYAHNPDSLKNVYETVRESIDKTGGRIIAVLGATGRRDRTKRPIMGALAGCYADYVIFTNEDPYDEAPEAIMEEVAEGIHRGSKKHQWYLNRNYWKVLDRGQAIHKAIKEAKKNDVVIITGKGAEEVMAVGRDKFVPFSDRKIARQELQMRFHEER